MKTKDLLLIALIPPALLLIPLAGMQLSPSWNWTWHDFVVAWVVFTATTTIFRLLIARPPANPAYRAGVVLAVAAGFLVTWITLAVQIIGDDNPANLLYVIANLTGLAVAGCGRLHPDALARAAYAAAAVVFLAPIIGVVGWPDDFSPGVVPVFGLNFGFVLMFAAAGRCFQRAAARPATVAAA